MVSYSKGLNLVIAEFGDFAGYYTCSWAFEKTASFLETNSCCTMTLEKHLLKPVEYVFAWIAIKSLSTDFSCQESN